MRTPYGSRFLLVAAGIVLVAQPTTAVTVGANVNVSRSVGNQSVGAVAIDPNDPRRAFVVSQDETGGMFAARSNDGGATWVGGRVATGVGPDGLPSACCNPSVSWDSFGNLFITYLATQPTFYVVVAVSTDGGATFTAFPPLGSNADQPTVATGSGSVWVTYNRGAIYAAGAAVTGLGAVGSFGAPELVPAPPAMNFGDIAVGPAGQVVVTYGPDGGQSGGTIYTNVDADGLGPGGFGPARAATTTNVGGFDSLPAQPSWGVDPEAGLAYDRTGGPHDGRLYLVYTDETPDESNDTDVLVRHSDDDGATWSGPVRVNDDVGTNSQFLPRIALDRITGAIGVSWYDTRNDPSNVGAQFFGAFSSDGGVTFTPNFRISAGTSSEAGADPPAPGHHDIDFGDYTGSSFAQGLFLPVWADNSNSTGDNPDGTLQRFDVYIAAVLGPGTGTPIVHVSFPPPAGSGWYTSSPVVGSVSATEFPAGGNGITGIDCAGATVGTIAGLGTLSASASLSVSAQGITTVSCTASDAAGNVGPPATTTVSLDGGAPQLDPIFSPSGMPILLNAVASASPNATDPLVDGFASGIASSSCGAVDTSSAGAKTLSCTASDLAGNTTTDANVGYVVGYAVSNLTPLPGTSFRRGATIRADFGLADANGQPIPNAVAAGLGCTVTVTFDGAAPGCGKYSKKTGTFSASIKTSSKLTPGAYALTVNVVVGTTSVATETVLVTITS